MKINYKKRTWSELKILAVSSDNSIDYNSYKNRYKITLKYGDTVFFTNLYKPGSKKPLDIIDEINDQDFNEFELNYINNIDNNPPFEVSNIDVNRNLPISTLDGKKLSVHSSSKPEIQGVDTYAVWSGSGDDVTTGMICGGEILEFDLVPGVPLRSIDVKFNQMMNGRVWIHEGYLKFENGGNGDYMEADIVSSPTPVQQSVNLDLLVDVDGWITYSQAGPGTGTHGFADASKIVLIPKTYSKNGDWDYDGTNLIPNFTSTGEYVISIIEHVIHRYMNKISCRGSCLSYFSMTSDETSEIFQNYFLRMSAHNVSDTTWNSSIIMELFRERTYNP